MSQSLEDELTSVLSDFSTALPPTDIANIRELLSAGEYGIGLEVLCAQLYEHAVTISPDQFERLMTAGKKMQLKSSAWEILKELVI